MIAGEAAARHWLGETLGADAAAFARLERLAALLVAENERQNLVARGSIAQLWQRHIADSAQLLALANSANMAGPWLDLGTGAGFPGLVIAALEPEREVVMIDSRRRRAEWLRAAADSLVLPGARIIHARVEDVPSRAFRVISARAFAPLGRLLTLSARFSTPDTLWLLPKGTQAQHELDALPPARRRLFHVEQSLTHADAGIIVGQLAADAAKGKREAQR